MRCKVQKLVIVNFTVDRTADTYRRSPQMRRNPVDWILARRAVERLAFVAKKLGGTEKENKLAPSFLRCKAQCHFSQSKDFPINGRIS